MNKICYRFSKKGTLHAPVRVRSSGHYLVEPDWHDLIMRKSFLELYWCVSGSGEFRLGSRSWQLHPGEICSYFPGDVHQVAACEEWEYCWLTIDGEFCADVIKGFGLTREPHRAGPCPQELFSRLRHELAIPGIDAESRAALIGYEILLRTVMPEKIPNIDLGRRFMAEVARRLDDPELNISELAAELGVHRTTLMRQVRAASGMSPQEYLIECRMQKALELLSNSSASIKEIAESAGFANANYFTKVFHRMFGRSPSELRALTLRSSVG